MAPIIIGLWLISYWIIYFVILVIGAIEVIVVAMCYYILYYFVWVIVQNEVSEGIWIY